MSWYLTIAGVLCGWSILRLMGGERLTGMNKLKISMHDATPEPPKPAPNDKKPAPSPRH